MYSFPNLEPVFCSMSDSNVCFLTCIQVSQEAGQVVWYSHLFKNFPQLVVIHTVKGFSIVSEAEADVFLEFPCFLHDPMNADNLISGSSASSKPCLYMWKFFNSCERELPDVQAGFLSSICNYLAGQIVFHWAISVLFIKCT